MKRKLNFSGLVVACTLFLLSQVIGCTTYRGVGRFESTTLEGNDAHDDEEELSAAGPSGPTLTWSGERRYTRPNDPIKFDWPVDEARMTRGFLLGGRKSHWGVDLANAKGTAILAAERGVVIYTGRGFRGYGNLIVIEHNEEWATLYSHLNKFSVKEGQVVERGQKIAEMGRTGHASGVHLHFEIRQNRQPVNPLGFLPEGF